MVGSSEPDLRFLVNQAVNLRIKDFSNSKFLKQMKERFPGYKDADYTATRERVNKLFDTACKIAFRWVNDNNPGAEFELPDRDGKVLYELKELCEDFTDDEYNLALEYGFQKTIF